MSNDRVAALVTGAYGALGSAIAAALRAAGADLYLLGRSAARLAALGDRLGTRQPGPGSLVPIVADLTDPGVMPRVIERLPARLDVLVNNAAVQGPIGPLEAVDWASWEATIRADLLAPVALTRAALPRLRRARRGKIIAISGGGATGPRPNFSAYAVAKTGLVRCMETLADELRPTGIDVNTISPGPFKSAMTDAILAAPLSGAAEIAAAATTRDAAGDADLERAAALVAYLASPASDGITGRLLSALWDPWPVLQRHAGDLAGSDVYTLRRIVPKDRGMGWGEP